LKIFHGNVDLSYSNMSDRLRLDRLLGLKKLWYYKTGQSKVINGGGLLSELGYIMHISVHDNKWFL
jgi:hypothetical protein